MWSDVNSQGHTEEDAFMIAKDVTQEEIEEFHRSSNNYNYHFLKEIFILILFCYLSQMVSFRPI
jgi:hypothetical protein